MKKKEKRIVSYTFASLGFLKHLDCLLLVEVYGIERVPDRQQLVHPQSSMHVSG